MIKGLLEQSDSILLRRTEVRDLDFVFTSEHSEENKMFVSQQTINEHQKMLLDGDILHLIVEEKSSRKSVGYVILAGFKNKNKSIELRRIVITEKGKGFGREAIKLCKVIAFEIEKAHRLWLDVRQHNKRAYNLYTSEGFVEEGTLRECVLNEGNFESLIVLSVLESEYKM